MAVGEDGVKGESEKQMLPTEMSHKLSTMLEFRLSVVGTNASVLLGEKDHFGAISGAGYSYFLAVKENFSSLLPLSLQATVWSSFPPWKT